MHLADYDIQQQLDFSETIADKYSSDGSELAAVCLDATYEPGQVTAEYFYSQGMDEEMCAHQVFATLDGEIIEEG